MLAEQMLEDVDGLDAAVRVEEDGIDECGRDAHIVACDELIARCVRTAASPEKS